MFFEILWNIWYTLIILIWYGYDDVSMEHAWWMMNSTASPNKVSAKWTTAIGFQEGDMAIEISGFSLPFLLRKMAEIQLKKWLINPEGPTYQCPFPICLDIIFFRRMLRNVENHRYISVLINQYIQTSTYHSSFLEMYIYSLHCVYIYILRYIYTHNLHIY
jgi:hypothetical protein